MTYAPIAVTIEYTRTRHSARIHHLAERLGFDIVPLLNKPMPMSLDAKTYAADLLRGLDGDERPVGLVVAFCFGSPIGHEVVRLLSERLARAPRYVSLDGAPVTAQQVALAYAEMVAAYGTGDHRPRVTVTGEALRDRPAELVADVRAELTELATARFRKVSQQPERAARMVDEVVQVSVEWIGHLVAGHNAAFPPLEGEVVLVTSAETAFPGPWPGAANTRRIGVDCPAADLVGRPEVARVLAEEMAIAAKGQPADV